jgi:hypothetical protein
VQVRKHSEQSDYDHPCWQLQSLINQWRKEPDWPELHGDVVLLFFDVLCDLNTGPRTITDLLGEEATSYILDNGNHRVIATLEGIEYQE